MNMVKDSSTHIFLLIVLRCKWISCLFKHRRIHQRKGYKDEALDVIFDPSKRKCYLKAKSKSFSGADELRIKENPFSFNLV